jgi:hypothetical protein
VPGAWCVHALGQTALAGGRHRLPASHLAAVQAQPGPAPAAAMGLVGSVGSRMMRPPVPATYSLGRASDGGESCGHLGSHSDCIQAPLYSYYCISDSPRCKIR